MDKQKAWEKTMQTMADNGVPLSAMGYCKIAFDTALDYSEQENRDLTDHIDLMTDEFKRIKALHYDKTSHNDEVRGLCNRAISNTSQRVPVILQRNNAENRADQLQKVVDKIARVASGGDQVADDDTEGLIWIRRFIAESV